MSKENFRASLGQWSHKSVEDWLGRLHCAIKNTSGADSISQETLAVLRESIYRLNDGLGTIKGLAQLLDGPELDALIDNVAGDIHKAFYLVSDLVVKLEWLFRGDTVVSHGECHARSWSEIVLKNCQAISFLIEKNVIITRELLDRISYDAYLVHEQLGVEFERGIKLWYAAQDAEEKLPKPGELIAESNESENGNSETSKSPDKSTGQPDTGQFPKKKTRTAEKRMLRPKHQECIKRFKDYVRLGDAQSMTYVVSEYVAENSNESVDGMLRVLNDHSNRWKPNKRQ